MTNELAGLLALNALFLLAGTGMLAALRPFETWGDALRLAGAGYLAGAAAVLLVSTELVIVSVPPDVPVVAAVALLLALGGLAVARLRGFAVPRVHVRRVREPWLALGVAAAALTLIFLENAFRVARLQPEVGGDSTAVWTPRGEIVYFFGGLDAKLWDLLGGQTYPILIPTLQAIDFHFMGGVDTVTLHVQYWLLLAGFVAAVAGLLRPHVPLAYVWPVLLLLVVMPSLDYWSLVPQADLPLQYFFACAGLCAWRWTAEREPWLLAGFALFAAAAMATKREGQLLVACLVLAVLAVTWSARRWAWPRIAAAAAAAFAVNLPWRLWFNAQDFTGETPGATLSQLLESADRIPPGLWLVLRLTFSWDEWLVAAPLGLAALAVAWLRGERRLAVFFGLLCAAIVAGFTWIVWSIDSLPIEPTDATPMPRAVGALVLLSISFAPLMLASARR